MSDLDDQVEDLVQQILDLNARHSGDYIIVIQSAAEPERTFTNWSWFYKPQSAGKPRYGQPSSTA